MTATVVIDSGAILVEQFVDEELGNSSYVLVDRDRGVAAVLDPPRDVDRHIDLAARGGWTVTTVLDTHVHNDFVSGGPNLRAVAAARYLVPAGAAVSGADAELGDGEEVEVGTLRLRAIHSPGHTPEHLSYLLLGPGNRPVALLSGGALMVGTMARPDLLGPSRTFGLARSGHATMQHLLSSGADDLLVLPTHGGGSFCGAAASDARVTTIGAERQSPLATAPDLAHFLAIHAKQGEYPAYYPRMAPLNRAGAAGPAVSPADLLTRLDVGQFEAALAAGALPVDCRPHEQFDSGHVDGALAVPLHGPFSPWVGWVLDIDDDVLLLAATEADAEEATRQLLRIGFTRIGRWLHADDWLAAGRPVVAVTRRTMSDLAEVILDGGAVTVIDVRQEHEWAAGHLPGAVHALPAQIPALVPELDRTAPVAVHCASGHRSALAASLLLRAGVSGVWHVTDNVDAWRDLGYPLVTAN